MRIILIMLLAVMSSNVMAEWLIHSGNEAVTLYTDSSTMHKKDNKVKIWSMNDYKSAQKLIVTEYMSIKMQSEIDCKEQQYRTLALLLYTGNMGRGNVVSNQPSLNGDWGAIAPETLAYDLWEIACKSGKQSGSQKNNAVK